MLCISHQFFDDRRHFETPVVKQFVDPSDIQPVPKHEGEGQFSSVASTRISTLDYLIVRRTVTEGATRSRFASGIPSMPPSSILWVAFRGKELPKHAKQLPGLLALSRAGEFAFGISNVHVYQTYCEYIG